MRRPFLRSKTISTKVTEAELARLQDLAAASGQGMSEWTREVMLAQLNPSLEILLAEVLAMRSIVLNVVYGLGRGEVPNNQTMQELIGRVDAGKAEKARERLGIPGGRPTPGKSTEQTKEKL